MNFIKLFILLIISFSSIQEANAGIFFNRRSYSTPTYSTQSYNRIPQYNGRVRQWTYPGDIKSHLRNHHHINTDGMSFQQMKHLHNVLHESGR